VIQGPAHLFAIVLAGPSGGGKTTVRTELLRRRSDLLFSVSATTRPARPGEVDGRDYQFLSRSDFERMVEEGDLLEWAEVHGQLYGTPRANLNRAWEARAHLLLDIDVQGARQLKEVQPDAVSVFLLPPDFESLVQRLRRRGSEDEDTFRTRMRTALSELSEVDRFDYVVVNEDLEDTVEAVAAIIATENHRVERLSPDARRRVEALSEAVNRMLEASAMEEARSE
jgi:guanylate kinase